MQNSLISWLFLTVAGVAHGSSFSERVDEVLHRQALGLADVEHGLPMTTETPIYIASVGKAFTTVAILQLVEHAVVERELIVDRMPGLPAYSSPFQRRAT